MAENEKHENEMSHEELQKELNEVEERIRRNTELLSSLRRLRSALEVRLKTAWALRSEKPSDPDEKEDPLYMDAVNLVLSKGMASVSLLQRKFSIGYGRSEKLLERMVAKGVLESESWTETRIENVTRYYIRGGGERQDGQHGNDAAPGK